MADQKNMGEEEEEDRSDIDECAAHRRDLRSDYLNIFSLITQNKDDIGRAFDSSKFDSLAQRVEDLHHHVNKPREQVADAEALLNLTGTLVAAVNLHGKGGITPSEFTSGVLKKFGNRQRRGSSNCSQSMLFWRDIGLFVSPVFQNARGCSTMLGPMKNHVKPRKVAVRRRYTKPIMSTQPESFEHTIGEGKSETDKNMVTMFKILSKKRSVKLDHLLLNRNSFAQTVENLFALSFLVKDGRVEIVVDEMGSHIVSPKNQPTASSVSSGEVKYSAFILRFDFKDWKFMKDQVAEGEELMPNRFTSSCNKAENVATIICSKAEAETDPISSQA